MKICVLVVDCLRPDHLGCYGYPKNTSPCIDRIASNSVLCESVYAQSNWTYPSVYSMLTGRYPTILNVNWFDQRVHRSFQTLPERLATAGYKNTIFSNFKVLLNAQGICSHFDEVCDVHIDQNSVAAFDRWSSTKGDSFLFFHIGEYVHEPYFAPRARAEQFMNQGTESRETPDTELVEVLTNQGTSGNSLRKVVSQVNKGLKSVSKFEIDRLLAHYDAGIHHVDGMIEKYHEMLKSCNDDYLFILIADHGQAFMEHNFFGHGMSLYNEVIKVPLIIDAGQRYRGRITTDLQLADLYPTILECVGEKVAQDINGVSFWDGLAGNGVTERPILVEGYPYVALIQNGKKLISAYSRHWSMQQLYSQYMKHDRVASWKLLLYSYLQRFRTSQLFDVKSDPHELKNLLTAQPDVVKDLHGRISLTLQQLLSGAMPPEKVSMNKEIEDQLEKLGYL